MIVLVHNIVPPYRVPLFNAINDECRGEFAVLLTRATHARRRRWRVPWEEVRFRHELLSTVGFEAGIRALDVSFGVHKALRRLGPRAVVVAGWDVPACWAALAWCRRRGVPAYAWVESSARSGSFRGRVSNRLRRTFLAACDGAIVPGQRAEQFVRSLRPGLRCTRMPNSVAVPELRRLPDPGSAGGVLFMGELSKHKGFDLLVDAVPGLVGSFDQVVVAGDGPLRSRLMSVAADEPRLRYLGFVEGVARASAMASACVLVLPSRRDPWPLVACEALVSGRPVVLGPGVGSRVDLEAVAGDAVVAMESSSADALVAGAALARGLRVPVAARGAFTPEESAAAFLTAVRT